METGPTSNPLQQKGRKTTQRVVPRPATCSVRRTARLRR
uniref:Uncharacterized protein n=1 Tax=Arundo donax TaxID=35708 RepID=A0A0A9HQ69_ARUDO